MFQFLINPGSLNEKLLFLRRGWTRVRWQSIDSLTKLLYDFSSKICFIDVIFRVSFFFFLFVLYFISLMTAIEYIAKIFTHVAITYYSMSPQSSSLSSFVLYLAHCGFNLLCEKVLKKEIVLLSHSTVIHTATKKKN